MRYESFYPFARQQSPPIMGQPSPDFYPMPGQYPQNRPFANNAMNARPPLPNGQPNNPLPSPPTGPTTGPPTGPSGQGPTKMEEYMQTANRFLNTAQQFAPVVQQFAPMVQNIPAMWRMYKGFQSLPTIGGTAASAASAIPRPSAVQNPSMPRIFQPPDR